MDDVTFDRELRERLQLLDQADGSTIIVPDLPLKDFLVAVISLAVVVAALMWWAY